MKRNIFAGFLILAAVVVVIGMTYVLFLVKGESIQSINQRTNTFVKIVAAENFYGDIAKQIGGNKVFVTSILSDPNIDPHEYESNVQDAVAIHDANIIIQNGLDYDTWIDKLISASPNPKRISIIAGNIAPYKLIDNPHVWYGLENIPSIAATITHSLQEVDPKDSAYFNDNMLRFIQSLQPIQQEQSDIKSHFGGTSIGLTETIYLYQTQSMGLNVITPFDFEKAVAEGNDPSGSSILVANQQVHNKLVKILIYNSQTVTSVTTHLLDDAMKIGIPTVSVSETMPKDTTYQAWMMSELLTVKQALQQSSQK